MSVTIAHQKKIFGAELDLKLETYLGKLTVCESDWRKTPGKVWIDV